MLRFLSKTGFQAGRLLNNFSKMVTYHELEGFEEFAKYVKGIQPGSENSHYFLFTGSKLENGLSWCPTCNDAYPVIQEVLKQATENTHYIKVAVGLKDIWRDSNCPFRTDSRIKLMVLPTLIRWKTPQRLEGSKCTKEDLVEMMFTDFDD